MEVCVESPESALNAEKGGAKQVELCANLLEGGTTPSVGMLSVIKSILSIPVFVMIRPRGGDFCYTATEMQVMKQDICSLKEAGADGFVFGLLTDDSDVDEKGCSDLLELCLPLPSTFHRAIDMTRDIFGSMEKIINLGFTRILSSGGSQTALLGSQVLRSMVQQASGKVIIVPGGGITLDNLAEILAITGATEFHGSARVTVDSLVKHRKSGVAMGSVPGTEYTRKVASSELVESLLKVAQSCWEGNISC